MSKLSRDEQIAWGVNELVQAPEDKVDKILQMVLANSQHHMRSNFLWSVLHDVNRTAYSEISFATTADIIELLQREHPDAYVTEKFNMLAVLDAAKEDSRAQP